MPSYTGTWDETKPAGSRARSLGDDDIRDFKRDIRERLATDHDFAQDESGNAKIGYHKKATLETTTTPTAVADTGIVYTKDVAGVAELHYLDENSNEIQLTSGGKIKKESIGNNAFVPASLICLMATATAIPTGWYECTGANGTPDMRSIYPTGYKYVMKA